MHEPVNKFRIPLNKYRNSQITYMYIYICIYISGNVVT